MSTGDVGRPDFGNVRPPGGWPSGNQDASQQAAQTRGGSDGGQLAKLFARMPPGKAAKRLSQLLEKSLKDPKLAEALLNQKIPPGSHKALAMCTLSCLRQIFGKSLTLTEEEEKEILAAIEREYSDEQPLDPDERKRRKQKRRQENKDKPKVNAILYIVEKSLQNLEGGSGELNMES